MKLLRRWRRGLDLAWPIVVEQEFNTLMRTVDVLVAGFLSPATIVAVELANLYAGLVRRLGHGLSSGVVAVTSQETGADRTVTRDDAITQALLLGFLLGVPFAVLGLALGDRLVALLGASNEVVPSSALYLAVVLAVAPARLVGLLAKRALHGVGDTRTPMYVNVAANLLNVLVTVGFGLGTGPLPRLGVLGIALGTALAHVFVAIVLVGALVAPRSPTRLVRPRNYDVGRQIVTIGIPSTASGFVKQGAYFLFNTVLLTFGTSVTAAYYVGRRVYQQVGDPLSRGYRDATGVMVGQAIGERDVDRAYHDGVAMSVLGAATMSLVGVGLFVFADPLVRIFTGDPGTIPYAITFLRVFAVAAPFLSLVRTFSASLTGGSETRVPFVATLTGRFGFTVGLSFLAGVALGYGVAAVYAALVLTQVWSAAVVGLWFHRRQWLPRAVAMMDARDGASDDEVHQ